MGSLESAIDLGRCSIVLSISSVSVVCSYSFVVEIVSVVFFFFCVFFQAEDGIRDLVRSRGLGDVYKRQVSAPRSSAPQPQPGCSASASGSASRYRRNPSARSWARQSPIAVSYTHLTLPTSDLV